MSPEGHRHAENLDPNHAATDGPHGSDRLAEVNLVTALPVGSSNPLHREEPFLSHRAIRSFKPPLVLAAAVALVLAANAASTQPTAHAAAATPPVVDIMASDYAFEAPDVLPAGLVTLRLMNHGQEPHHAQLLRLNDDVTFDQFAAALQTEGEGALRLAALTGGPGAIEPAQERRGDARPDGRLLRPGVLHRWPGRRAAPGQGHAQAADRDVCAGRPEHAAGGWQEP